MWSASARDEEHDGETPSCRHKRPPQSACRRVSSRSDLHSGWPGLLASSDAPPARLSSGSANPRRCFVAEGAVYTGGIRGGFATTDAFVHSELG